MLLMIFKSVCGHALYVVDDFKLSLWSELTVLQDPAEEVR